MYNLCFCIALGLCFIKLAFHDADTDTNILARMSVSVSGNASFIRRVVSVDRKRPIGTSRLRHFLLCLSVGWLV